MESAGLFSFPHPVNDVSARLVAGGVALMVAATLVFDVPWMMVVIAYGFVARVLTGPKLSPLGLLVTRVVVPRLPVGPKMVSGPPKRFAQGMGAVMSVTALVLYFWVGSKAAAYGVLAVLGSAATLESVFAFCLGCKVFAVLMRLNVIPERVCAECSDIQLRQRRRPPSTPVSK